MVTPRKSTSTDTAFSVSLILTSFPYFLVPSRESIVSNTTGNEKKCARWLQCGGIPRSAASP